MSIRVWVDFTGSFEEITDYVIVNGSRIRYINGTDEYKYAPDIFDFRLKVDATNLIKTFANSDNPIPILVTSDDTNPTYHYNGYALPDVNSLRITDNNFGDISLSCLDSLEVDLDIPCPDLTYRGETLNFIITDLFSRVNSNYTLVLPSEFDDITIPYMIKEAEEDTYIDIVDNLVWEHGYTLYAIYTDQIKRAGFRKWFHNPVEADVLVGNSFDPNSLPRRIIEPLEINEREIPEKLVSVAGRLYNIFIGDTNRFTGFRLYYEVPPVESDDALFTLTANNPYYPIKGNLEIIYQKYSSTREGDEELKVLDAWDQRVYGYYFPIGNSIQPIVDEEGSLILLPVEEYYSTKSRIVMQFNPNNTGGATEAGITGWEIRGSAAVTYGDFTVLDGIDTEAIEFNLMADPIEYFGRFGYRAPGDADLSDEDDFYNGWRLVTENGTNTKVFDYLGSIKQFIVEPDNVSENDTMGDTVTLISPLKGLKEKKIKSEYILVYKGEDTTILDSQEGVGRLRDLCEGYKNILATW